MTQAAPELNGEYVEHTDLIAHLETEVDRKQEFAGAILTCPVCNTVIDADNWGLNLLECNNCETKIALVLDPQTVAEHGI